MAFIGSHEKVRDIVRGIWHKLTDAEIEACQEQRDVFFCAVRKKHGLARAQAELLLHDLERQYGQAV